MMNFMDMCRLTEEFFSFLKSEIGSLRFGVNQTVVNADYSFSILANNTWVQLIVSDFCDLTEF